MLQAYKINNTPITQITNWSISMLDGNPSFIVSDILNTKYDDVSSITNWKLYGYRLKDYNFIRDRIKEITYSVGFDNLSYEEKVIASEYFVVGKTERDTVMSEEEQYEFWDTLITESQNSRFIRWEHAKKYISYVLSPINSSDLAKSTSELCNDYINYNIITKVKDGISGIFDYLKGEGDYTTNGYPSKTYWTQVDQDRMMDILQNGYY